VFDHATPREIDKNYSLEVENRIDPSEFQKGHGSFEKDPTVFFNIIAITQLHVK